MEPFVRPEKNRSRRLVKALPLGLALLLLCRGAGAQTTVNQFVVGANGVNPLVNYLTQIYATNFINGAYGQFSQFSYTQNYTGSQTWLGALYHNWYNTVNFTNQG